ncbi:unnamed protein product [Orchesella dallaii]|uniref:C2H2-type domain-containing protein n=1 Tax=Orchesella dallaii TaxID=48710 RepID=A0ABP1R2B1_9HEXA
MEENTVNCLFCALPCSPDFVINSCGRVKSENENNSLEDNDSYNFPFHGTYSSLPPSFSFGGDDKAIEEHLRAVFILTKILKIPYETLCQFLGKGNGQFSPEMWFNVCESCGNSVTQFYTTLKQLSKLERKLASLQTQLIDKMRTSQDVENNDFVWKQIREEALQQFSASPPTCDEEIVFEPQTHFQIADENWNSGNNHAELNQAGTNKSSYAQPVENESFEEENYSSFENDNHDDEEEDEEDEIHFVTDFVPPPPPPSTKRYFYRCQLCSYQCNTKKDFEAHMKLHEEGSGAIICSDCGRPVLPNKLRWHVGQCRAGIVGNYGYKKGPKRDSNSNLPKPPGKFYYQCGQCPFETNSNVRYATHLELHGEGSTAVVCRECGYFVEPSQLHRHKVLRHSANRIGRGSVKERKKKSVKTHRDDDEDEEWKF